MSRLVQLLSIFFAFAGLTSALVALPRELSAVTGLSDAHLRRLVTPAANCSVNDTAGGVFPGPGSPSALDLVKRNSFVKRVGTKLQLAGQEFRIVGANIYWLGLDENVM